MNNEIDSFKITVFPAEILLSSFLQHHHVPIFIQVFYFMQPETTITKLADDLLKAVHDKFIKAKQEGAEEDEQNEGEEEPLLEKQGFST